MTNESSVTIRNAQLCQVKDERVVPVFCDVQIEGGRIAGITAAGAGKSSAVEIDAAGRVVTIPLVNFHEHCYSYLAKGLAVHGSTDTFLQILEHLWWVLDRALDAEMIRACAELAAREALSNGVTYIFDHHASPSAVSGSLSIIAEVFAKHGLRSVLSYETSDRNGAENTHLALNENRDFIAGKTNRTTRGMLGLHAPFTLTDDTLRTASQLREELQVGIHIHVSEDRYELDHSLRSFGIVPILRLQNFDLLTVDSIVAHGVHLSRLEYLILAQSGAAIACCPDSNFNNAVGVPDYASIPREIPILAGTDGMHGNVAATLKQLFLLYRDQGNSFAEAFEWIRRIYFGQIAFVRRYFPDYPSLAVGDRGDLVIWDYVPPAPLTEDNFFGHFVYGILNTRIYRVLQDGLPCGTDEGTLHADVYRQGERLHKRFAELELLEKK